MPSRSKILSLFSAFLVAFTVLAVLLHFAFGFQYVVVLTDSMEPHVNPGDLIVTYPAHDVKPGDVILYRLDLGGNRYYITHRVVGTEYDGSGRLYYITKGDNREFRDPWKVYPDQIVGKVLLAVPAVGRLFEYAGVIVLLIFLALIASIAYEIGVVITEGGAEEKNLERVRKTGRMYLVRRARRPGRGHF